MKKILILLFIVGLLSSCGTLFNVTKTKNVDSLPNKMSEQEMLENWITSLVESNQSAEISKKEFTAEISTREARYVRVSAENIGICPEWHMGAGGKAWIFVDEIIIE